MRREWEEMGAVGRMLDIQTGWSIYWIRRKQAEKTHTKMNANTFPILLKVSVAVDMTFQLNGLSRSHSEGVFRHFPCECVCTYIGWSRNGAWCCDNVATDRDKYCQGCVKPHTISRAAMRPQSPENSTREKNEMNEQMAPAFGRVCLSR